MKLGTDWQMWPEYRQLRAAAQSAAVAEAMVLRLWTDCGVASATPGRDPGWLPSGLETLAVGEVMGVDGKNVRLEWLTGGAAPFLRPVENPKGWFCDRYGALNRGGERTVEGQQRLASDMARLARQNKAATANAQQMALAMPGEFFVDAGGKALSPGEPSRVIALIASLDNAYGRAEGRPQTEAGYPRALVAGGVLVVRRMSEAGRAELVKRVFRNRRSPEIAQSTEALLRVEEVVGGVELWGLPEVDRVMGERWEK